MRSGGPSRRWVPRTACKQVRSGFGSQRHDVHVPPSPYVGNATTERCPGLCTGRG